MPLRRIPWQSQPQEVARAVGEGYGAGLIHSWGLAVGGVRKLYDSAGNLHANFGVGTGGTSGNIWRRQGSENYVEFNDGGSGVASAVLPVGDASGSGSPRGNKFSLQAKVRLASINVNIYQTIYGGGAGEVQLRVSNIGRLELLKSEVAFIGDSQTQLLAGVDYDIGVSYDGSLATFYINGLPDRSVVGAQTFGLNTQYFLGAKESTGTVERIINGGCIYRLNLWNRPRCAAEFLALAKDPWQIYEPRRVKIPSTAVVDAAGSSSDTAAAGDVQSAVLSASSAVGESLAIADSWSAALSAAASSVESATAADTQSPALVGTATTTAESASVGDTATAAAALEATHTEVAVTGDLAASSRASAAVGDESAAASDLASAALAGTATQADSAGTSDSAAAQVALNAEATETAVVSDADSCVLTAPAAQAETLSIADSHAGNTVGNYSAGAIESAAISETAAKALSAAAAASDSLAPSDALAGAWVGFVTASESAGVSDASSASAAADYIAACAESSSANDSAAAIAALTASRADVAAVADVQTRAAQTFASVLETATPIDLSAAAIFVPGSSESEAWTYTVEPDNLSFSLAPDNMSYQRGAVQ